MTLTIRLFLAAVILTVGYLITAKVYESQGNHRMYKVCHLISSLSLLSLIIGGVAYIILTIGKTFI